MTSMIRHVCNATLLPMGDWSAQILSVFQLLVACQKALHADKSGALKTRNIYTEIIYSLSPSKNVCAWVHICHASHSAADC